MFITKIHQEAIIGYVEDANRGYNLLSHKGGQESTKSIDILTDYCRSIANIEVYEHEQYHAGGLPRGVTITYQNDYKIWILSGMNFCWNRFVLCKELFHILIDMRDAERVFSNKDVGSHIDQYLLDFDNTTIRRPTPDNVQAELLAEIAAMEFMFPYTHRLAQAARSSHDISEAYKLPKALIEKYLSERYMANLARKIS